jgi:hypothetical protein
MLNLLLSRKYYGCFMLQEQPSAKTISEFWNELNVRELVGWVRNVVLMNVYFDLENPGGSGFWVGGSMSQGREMGELVYEQPGNEVDGSCHSKEGSK